MKNDFYYEQDYRYLEVGEVLAAGDTLKVRIGSILPKLDPGSPKKTKKPRDNVSNILNKNARSAIKGVTLCNYIPIPKPDGIKVSKGDKVLVAFAGGEINDPRIVGKY